YRMVDFLNGASASGSYSTRALAAMLTLADSAGDRPGVVAAYHESLFTEGNQPEENSTTDWSNQQLADLALQLGVDDAVVVDIASGVDVPGASGVADGHLDQLREVAAKEGRGAGTPTVAVDDTPVSLQQTDWLDDLLAD